MHLIQPALHSRRAFLRRSGQLALSGTALPFALNLAAIGEAAAFNATDYKALVCVFLYGGNDYANTVVTYDDPSYNIYSTIRGGGAGQTAGGIALAKSALTPTLLNPPTALPGARQYALHPSMTGLASLFNLGHAAVQLNVGPLVVPLTRTQYNSADRSTWPLPPKLFSHNDQQSIWQSSSPEGSTIGWGGNLGDLALGGNSNSLFTCISVTGNAVFLSGDSALQYQVSTGGAVAINSVKSNVYGSAAVKAAMATLVQQSRTNLLENEYNRVTTRAVTAESQVTSALASYPAANAPFSTFPASNPLADQLKMVARLIAARSALGATRQVFMVSIGGFDLHDNGDGADHGWGSHHLMVGGAVKGAAFYGTPPPVSVGNTAAPEDQWHVGQGRLLPSTSVDQYAATLARWFGVADSELAGILPNLGHFGAAAGRPDYPSDLGFMR